jgi:hypothetical protein
MSRSRQVWVLVWFAVALLVSCADNRGPLPPVSQARAGSPLPGSFASPLRSAGIGTVTSGSLMDWAEATYPHLFPVAGKVSGTEGPYDYRFYPGSSNYIGVTSGDQAGVYIYGELTAWVLTYVGALADFSCTVWGTCNCSAQERIGDLIACLDPATLDGAPFAYQLSPAGASGDLDGDGLPDLVLSANWATSATVPTPVQFYRGSSDPKAFFSWQPVIAGGASSLFTRNILIGDFNADGKADFYLADATEYSSPQNMPWFDGNIQYGYVQTGSGFQKVDIGVGKKTVHGAGTASVTRDGFGLVVNTPWQPVHSTYNMLNTTRFNGLTPVTTKYLWDNQLFKNGNYIAVVDANGDGVKDLLLLNNYVTQAHRVFLNDGTGRLTPGREITSQMAHGQIHAENAAVADFNGDGLEDVVVMFIDRSQGIPYRSILRVYINDGAAGFQDQTQTWLGATHQAHEGGFFDFYVGDVDGDGRPDLVFTTQLSGAGFGQNVQASLRILHNTGASLQPLNFSILAWQELLQDPEKWMPGSVVPVPRSPRASYLISRNGLMYSVRFVRA